MLPILYNVPRNERDWSLWSLSHQASHTKIIQKITANKGPPLTLYQFDPMDLNHFPDFLNRNQQAHNDMVGVLNIPGADLSEVDIKNANQLRSWIQSHAQEHREVEYALGI